MAEPKQSNKKNKIVSYPDPESGIIKKAMLPIDAPDSDAPIGVPVGIDLGGLYPEPFASRIAAAMEANGLVTPEDLDRAGADDLIRRSVWSVVRVDVQDIKKHIRGQNND